MSKSTPEEMIARKVIRTLKAAGTPVVTVYDGGDYVDVPTEEAAMEAGFAVDIFHLITASGAAVMIVNGNEWDALTDWNVSLQEPMQEVCDWIEKQEG